MDFAKKRDEETKNAKVELEKLQGKLQEEEALRQRDKTLLMQKDNKIRMLEAKLGGAKDISKQEPQPKSALKSASQR